MSHRIQDIVCDCVTIPVWNRVAVVVTVVSGQSLFCFSKPTKKVIFSVNAVSGAECFRILVVLETSKLLKYRKILFFEGPFRGTYVWRGLYSEGLIYGGAYLRREICVLKSIGLALYLEVNLPFLLCFTLYLRAIFQVQAPGGLYLEGRFNGGFFALPVWGAYIWTGLYMKGLIFGILR